MALAFDFGFAVWLVKRVTVLTTVFRKLRTSKPHPKGGVGHRGDGEGDERRVWLECRVMQLRR
jgi:hypothetical protein